MLLRSVVELKLRFGFWANFLLGELTTNFFNPIFSKTNFYLRKKSTFLTQFKASVFFYLTTFFPLEWSKPFFSFISESFWFLSYIFWLKASLSLNYGATEMKSKNMILVSLFTWCGNTTIKFSYSHALHTHSLSFTRTHTRTHNHRISCIADHCVIFTFINIVCLCTTYNCNNLPAVWFQFEKKKLSNRIITEKGRKVLAAIL